MASPSPKVRRPRQPYRGGSSRATGGLAYVSDVLVIGGGPAGAWAALTARAAGCEVILVDKGYLGTSGATAPSSTETWCVPPDTGRDDAVARHAAKTGGFCDTRHVHRVLDSAWRGLSRLAEWHYPFPSGADGRPYLGNLRGPDYMRFLRRRVIGAGVQVLDHHPALELLADAEGVGGAAGLDRQLGNAWQVRASAVVLATGGCAFGDRILGATGLTGDGYLMAAEAGATLSGMEMSSQYAVAVAGSSLNKGMPYRWATFYDADGRELGEPGEDRQLFVAHALLQGPVYARLDRAGAQEREWLRRGIPNGMLPFDRNGIDPFVDRFAVTLRCEGTVRGVGGLRLASDDCATDVTGLYAAGDVASREDLSGPITGGGGPNASWAIASGVWAGEAAARFTRLEGGTRYRQRLVGQGITGLRPRARRRNGASAPNAGDIVAAVRTEMLPLDRNFFRAEPTLSTSLERLDRLWASARERLDTPAAGAPFQAAKDREAAALLATSRWCLASALERRESRGMHRRTDHPTTHPAAPRRVRIRGVDAIEIIGGPEGGPS